MAFKRNGPSDPLLEEVAETETATVPQLVRAVVARGHSVDIKGKLFGPGTTVNLPADEVAFLTERGFFVTPEGEQLPTPQQSSAGVSYQGPTFTGNEPGRVTPR